MKYRRVVVTGLGLVTPLGLSVEESWKNILAGKSGANIITEFDVSEQATKFAAQVKDFDPTPYIPAKDIKKVDLFIQYGLSAAAQAIEQSGLTVTEENAARIGVALGSGIGGLAGIEKGHDVYLNSGPRRISPFFIPSIIINMLAGRVSLTHGLKGPNIAVVSACTTGTHNIGYGARSIAYGDADVMIVGGAEKASTPLGIGGFAAVRALSRNNENPQAACRPWDKNRDGFVLGDGAGVLVLEEYEHAKKRGANVIAELAGFGQSADAFHITLPDQNGMGAITAMTNALNDAEMSPAEVQYINAHATSTPAGDELECIAVKQVFDGYVDKIAMSSIKSMIGHLLGAAGAVEAVVTLLAMRDQIAPPTINLEDVDDNCKDIDLVANQAKEMPIQAAISNSFGFGGTNAALLFTQLK